MVLTDSHGISRAPCYLGYFSGAHNISVTGLTPSVPAFQDRSPIPEFLTLAVRQRQDWKVPQPRPCNARRLSHMERFSLIRVRSPLLTESLLFSLPAGTEMFHFPAFPPRTLCVQMRVTGLALRRGFPIRTPWDHSPVIDSPRLIADSYVLLRLLMPRHPPCALKNLTTKDLASTEKFSNTQRQPDHDTGQPTSRLTRCSRPLCSSQTTTRHHRPAPTRSNQQVGAAGNQKTQARARPSSGPNSVPNTDHTRPGPRSRTTPPEGRAGRTGSRHEVPAATSRYSTREHPPQNNRLRTGLVLLTPHPLHTRGDGGCKCSLERR